MKRKQWTQADLVRARKRLAQAPKVAPMSDADEPTPIGVNGGFRAGKRKRGNSLLKRAPKQQAHAITYYVRDEHGQYVTQVRTLKYRRDA